MDNDYYIGYIAIFVVVFLLWLGLWRLGHSKTTIGRIVKMFWNFSITLGTIVPVFGRFFALFLIADSDEELKAKEQILKDADKRDAAYMDTLEQRKQAYEREQEEYWNRLAQDEAARRAKEDELRGAAYRKYGSRDVQLNSDGSRAKMGDGDWVPTSELEKSLRN